MGGRELQARGGNGKGGKGNCLPLSEILKTPTESRTGPLAAVFTENCDGILELDNRCQHE